MNRTTIILICLVAIVAFATHSLVSNGNRYVTWVNARDIITVTVESGDTLDEFGYKYKPEWMDVREYRELVKELNGMENSSLYVGQELKLYI